MLALALTLLVIALMLGAPIRPHPPHKKGARNDERNPHSALQHRLCRTSGAVAYLATQQPTPPHNPPGTPPCFQQSGDEKQMSQIFIHPTAADFKNMARLEESTGLESVIHRGQFMLVSQARLEQLRRPQPKVTTLPRMRTQTFFARRPSDDNEPTPPSAA